MMHMNKKEKKTNHQNKTTEIIKEQKAKHSWVWKAASAHKKLQLTTLLTA